MIIVTPVTKISTDGNSHQFLFQAVLPPLEKKVKAILLVIHGRQPDSTSISLACELALLVNAAVTGLFIEGPEPEQLEESPRLTVGEESAGATVVRMDTEQAMALFKDICERQGVIHEVRVLKERLLDSVLRESRFADLLVVPPQLSPFGEEVAYPSLFVKTLLRKADCPLLLAPTDFDGIEEIVFCYEGSRSAVFAIKQFTYLFPELRHKKVLLLEVSRHSHKEFNGADRRMMDWLRDYYPHVYYQSLSGDPKEELFTYFFMKQKRMIVMGAFGRPWLSRWFKQSRAEMLIRNIDLPLFITHL